MLKGLRVPTHRVDAPGVLILPHDDAWDRDRIEAEGDELEAAALADLRARAVERRAADLGLRPDEIDDAQRAEAEDSCALTDEERTAVRSTHPVARYLAGHTRHQPDAPDQGPRGPARARDYLRPGAVPTQFELRRIPWQERARIDLDPDRVSRWSRLVRAGVSRVSEGEHTIWAAKDRADVLPDDLLERLADAEGGYVTLIQIAGACAAYSQPLTEAEGKR